MASIIRNIHTNRVFTNVLRQKIRAINQPTLLQEAVASRAKLAYVRTHATQATHIDESDVASYQEQPSTHKANDTPSFSSATDVTNSLQTTETLDDGKIDWSKSFYGLSAQAFPKEAAEILLAPLDVNDIECKPDGMLYLPEIKYRRILNRAFGPGAWGLAPRGENSVSPRNISREYALVCHGRLVSVSRGEQEYFDSSGLATAAEGAKSNALMRCCKDLGIGSELWDPRFIREFKATYCEEAMAEHVTQKKRKKVWKRKDTPLEYPYRLVPPNAGPYSGYSN